MQGVGYLTISSKEISLKKLAFIVPNGPNKYYIKGPSNVSECTLVHIPECYFDLNQFKCEESIYFEGSLVELLEKYKGNDDVQILFLAQIKVRFFFIVKVVRN